MDNITYCQVKNAKTHSDLPTNDILNYFKSIYPNYAVWQQYMIRCVIENKRHLYIFDMQIPDKIIFQKLRYLYDEFLLEGELKSKRGDLRITRKGMNHD